ncbi:hypothetical protein NP254_23830 [Salmonella enterica]|nr:hypothetical protein [Salmonella enterica]
MKLIFSFKSRTQFKACIIIRRNIETHFFHTRLQKPCIMLLQFYDSSLIWNRRKGQEYPNSPQLIIQHTIPHLGETHLNQHKTKNYDLPAPSSGFASLLAWRA